MYICNYLSRLREKPGSTDTGQLAMITSLMEAREGRGKEVREGIRKKEKKVHYKLEKFSRISKNIRYEILSTVSLQILTD